MLSAMDLEKLMVGQKNLKKRLEDALCSIFLLRCSLLCTQVQGQSKYFKVIFGKRIYIHNQKAFGLEKARPSSVTCFKSINIQSIKRPLPQDVCKMLQK